MGALLANLGLGVAFVGEQEEVFLTFHALVAQVGSVDSFVDLVICARSRVNHLHRNNIEAIGVCLLQTVGYLVWFAWGNEVASVFEVEQHVAGLAKFAFIVSDI